MQRFISVSAVVGLMAAMLAASASASVGARRSVAHARSVSQGISWGQFRDGYHDFNLDQAIPVNRNIDIWFGWLANGRPLLPDGSS